MEVLRGHAQKEYWWNFPKLSDSLEEVADLARSVEVENRGPRISGEGMGIVMSVIEEEEIYREPLRESGADEEFGWESPIGMIRYIRKKDGSEAFGREEYLGDYSFLCKDKDGCGRRCVHWLIKSGEFGEEEEREGLTLCDECHLAQPPRIRRKPKEEVALRRAEIAEMMNALAAIEVNNFREMQG